MAPSTIDKETRTFSFDGESLTVPRAQLNPVGQNPLVSIVLVSARRGELLRNTLLSIEPRTYKNVELIVVEADYDGGLTKKIADEFGTSYYLRTNTKDRRTSVANNVGIKHARGQIVLLQCAEIIHKTPDVIEKMIAPIIEDPSVSTFPAVLDMDPNGKPCGWKYRKETHPHCFITFAQAFAREAFVSIGGFDENYVNWGLEDNDFNFRLQYSGVKCMHVETVVSHQWHLPPPLGEQGQCQKYYGARLAAIRAGKETVVANQDHDWGSCYR